MISKLINFIGIKFGIISELSEEDFEILWKSECISAELLSDNTYLKIGKFIQLEQELDDGEFGWNQSKFNIPNTWHVNSVKVEAGIIVVNVKDHGEFQICKQNFGTLQSAILNDGQRDDAALFEVWKKHGISEKYS